MNFQRKYKLVLWKWHTVIERNKRYKWEKILCSWIRKLNTVKMTMLPKLIYRFSAILIRIPNNIFAEIDNLILNIKNFQMFKLDLEKAEEQRSNCQHPLDHRQSKRVPEKHLFLLYWLHQSLWLCGLQQTVGNSSRDGNARPPYLPPEKSVCRSRSNS